MTTSFDTAASAPNPSRRVTSATSHWGQNQPKSSRKTPTRNRQKTSTKPRQTASLRSGVESRSVEDPALPWRPRITTPTTPAAVDPNRRIKTWRRSLLGGWTSSKKEAEKLMNSGRMDLRMVKKIGKQAIGLRFRSTDPSTASMPVPLFSKTLICRGVSTHSLPANFRSCSPTNSSRVL